MTCKVSLDILVSTRSVRSVGRDELRRTLIDLWRAGAGPEGEDVAPPARDGLRSRWSGRKIRRLGEGGPQGTRQPRRVAFGSTTAPRRHCAWRRGGTGRRSGHGASPRTSGAGPSGQPSPAGAERTRATWTDRLLGEQRDRFTSAEGQAARPPDGAGSGDESAAAPAEPRPIRKDRAGASSCGWLSGPGSLSGPAGLWRGSPAHFAAVITAAPHRQR